MNDRTIARALLVLRFTLGVFLLQWGVEKFVVPGNTPAIWGYFYGLSVPEAAAYALGVLEIALAGCFILGIYRTMAYAAGAAIHAVSVAVSWPILIDPWGGPSNHLFVAGLPVLGGFVALYMLRHYDRPLFGGA